MERDAFLNMFKLVISHLTAWNCECVSYEAMCLRVSHRPRPRHHRPRQEHTQAPRNRLDVPRRSAHASLSADAGLSPFVCIIRDYSDYSVLLDELKNTPLTRVFEEYCILQRDSA